MSKICGIFSVTAPLPRLSAPSLGPPYIQSAIFPVDNMHAHCAFTSSPRFTMDAPCHKLFLRSNFTMIILGLESFNLELCILVRTLYIPLGL